MSHSTQQYLQAAIDLAYKNVDKGGSPFGAVIVSKRKIIAQAVNEIHLFGDLTAHAEFLAIKRASQALGSDDLSDCVVYASGQPCPFCLGTMALYGIKSAFYAYSGTQWREVAPARNYAPVDSVWLNPSDSAPLYSYWKQRQARA